MESKDAHPKASLIGKHLACQDKLQTEDRELLRRVLQIAARKKHIFKGPQLQGTRVKSPHFSIPQWPEVFLVNVRADMLYSGALLNESGP